MTRPNDDRSEKKALDALGMLAFLSHRSTEWTEEEVERFLREEAHAADLSEEEIAGTGEFAFEKIWSRIRAGERRAPPSVVEPEAAPAEATAMHRGESKIPEAALEELARRRREALGDDEDDGAGHDGENTGD